MTLTGDNPWFSVAHLRQVLGKLPGGLAVVDRHGQFVDIVPTAAVITMEHRRHQTLEQLFPPAIAEICHGALDYVLRHQVPITQSFPDLWLTVQLLPFTEELILWHEQSLIQNPNRSALDLELTQLLVRELEGRKQVTAILVENLDRMERISAMVTQLNEASALDQIYAITVTGMRRVLKSSFVVICNCNRGGTLDVAASEGLSIPVQDLLATLRQELGDRPPEQPTLCHTAWHTLSIFPLHAAEPRGAPLLGLIVVGYESPGHFGETERHMTQTLATYVTIAIGRQRIAESLRQREWELAEAHRIAYLGKWEWDLQTHEFTASPEFALLLGEPRQPLRLSFAEFIHRVPPEYQSQIQQLPQQLPQNGAIVELEFPIRHLQGDLHILYSKCQCWTNGNNTPIKISGIAQDVTSQRQADAIRLQLAREQELNQLQVRFFSMMSHEFRTPLSVITNSVHLLKLYSQKIEPDIGKPLQRHIQHVDNSARILTGLLEEILTLNRAEVGHLDLQKDLICLPEFCRQLLEHIGSLHRHSFFLENHLPERSYWIETDSRLLQCLLNNLLNFHHSEPADPTIIILQQTSEHLIIQVRHPHGSVDPQSSLRYVELGLGLTAAQRCADPLNGVITYLRNTYTVALPLSIVAEPTLP
ncbi:MAG: PAS domain-containing sensor histidine kinase [Oscillatoriales cyanobacterium SM2_2_1]|nr:PAS domain-containing sensor histidine kinase [Oscillatoriales cyanobacterium SM2_2_1]